MIHYITHDSIRKDKWDMCIERSVNRLPFAYSWVLDINSPGWDALVLDDYVAVMPLTWRSRLGVLYICQPTFCQQLGVFSIVHHAPFCIDDFIRAIPGKFKRIELAINSMNYVSGHFPRTTKRFNQVLDLDRSYGQIQEGYKGSHLRNLGKYIQVSSAFNMTEGLFLNFFSNKLESFKNKKIRISRYDKMAYFNMLKTLDDRQKLEILVVKDAEGSEMAGVCFAQFGERIYVHTYCKAEGRKHALVFFLIDRFIQRNAGKHLILDFMGSSVPGVKYRNMGFGCEETIFWCIGVYRWPAVIDKLISAFRKSACIWPVWESGFNGMRALSSKLKSVLL